MAAAIPSARRHARGPKQRRDKVRRFVTPEGVDLSLQIASAAQRFGALALDFTIMLVILILFTIAMVWGGLRARWDLAIIIWLLGFFLLRNFWFVLFELGPRAATPGKRAAGIRVVARDGGRLTVASVVARNLVRELELFLPITFLAANGSGALVDGGLIAFGLLWTLGMGFFLLFNRDRMRLGDLIGGTWVVMARRRKIARDLSDTSAARVETVLFTPQELSVYGVFELQELERVLREGDKMTKINVADTIRAKLGRDLRETDDDFLEAYYRQAKTRMERDLLFGKRRENKYEDAA